MKENNIKLDNLDKKIDDIRSVTYEIASRSVPNPPKKKDTHGITLFQSKLNKKELILIRGTNQHISKKKNQLKDSHKIILDEYNANPINYYIRLKEEIKKHNSKVSKVEKGIEVEENCEEIDHIDFHYNTIKLGKSCPLKDLKKLITDSIQEKYDEYNIIH
jgi:hypothetical protein